MDRTEKTDFLSEVELFRDVEPPTVAAVADAAEILEIPAGDYLFREGEPAEYMFAIVRGSLEVHKSTGAGVDITLRTMKAGEVGGLTSMAVPKDRSASLRVRDPLTALIVQRQEFLALLDAHPDLARSVIELLGAKVRGKTSQLADFLARESDSGRFPVAVFDAKPYDRRFLDEATGDDLGLHYFETRLQPGTVGLARGFPAVCVFVNDELNGDVLARLADGGLQLVALRCAGFNNVDIEAAARHRVSVVRVPGYSPHAVAEHTVAMILTLNRKTHRAYQRVREGNFSLNGLVGFDLHGRTAGIVGLGKIGRCLAENLLGFGMTVLANDAYPDAEFAERSGVQYVELDELLARADIVSLNAPLTPATHHLVDSEHIGRMKRGVMLINTSRGALVDAAALVAGLKSGQIGAAGLDVYEEESEYFFQDHSEEPISDDVLARLLTFPNVLVTSHQAFLTQDALRNIADTTMQNIREFKSGRTGADLTNAVLPAR